MRKVILTKVSREFADPYVDFALSSMTGDVYMGSHDEHIIFFAGVEPVNPGCGEIWVMYQVKPGDYPMAWMTLKDLFDKVFKDYRRLQSHVVTGSVSEGFNEHLGMEKEGIMRKYVGDVDYTIMARVN